ncbi:hypothetical protein FG877_02715 [Enterococcus casseliflavus]|nr:hypothetical protein [Enterococcus casseliflavus]
MKNDERELKEIALIVLYIITSYEYSINMNTFKRYLYLYYISSGFLNEESKGRVTITLNKSKTEFSILGLSGVMSDLETVDFIKLENSEILISNKLVDRVKTLLENEEGVFFEKYKRILSFVNLLYSYEDDYIFTVFFSEPTIKAMVNRNLDDFSSETSILVKWLNEFKKKVKQNEIDNYDILSHWIEFVLEKYYEGDVDDR